jgi:hypothetical protein
VTRCMLEELSRVFALESCDLDLEGRSDEAMQLAETASVIRERAAALSPRALPYVTPEWEPAPASA